MAGRRDQGAPIVICAYDLCAELCEHVNRFLRAQRALLGRVLLDEALRMLAALTAADRLADKREGRGSFRGAAGDIVRRGRVRFSRRRRFLSLEHHIALNRLEGSAMKTIFAIRIFTARTIRGRGRKEDEVMLRRIWKLIAVLAAGVLLALPAAAQDGRDAQAELAVLLASDDATSAQMALGLLRALEGEAFAPPACVAGQEMFDDVPASNQFCPFIEELARRGITSGCGGGNFCPADPVSRAQMATFIVKALEATEDCNTGLAGNDKMVRVGSVCIDKYEASIWTQRVGGTQITGEIPCAADGQDCKGKIFARSVAGVRPRSDITWFQAQQALANSGKRLPSNAEWQMAVAGTPDGPPCGVNAGVPVDTGSLPGCVSNHGVSDMVGNVWEWVADWVPLSTDCPDWGSFSDDRMCLAGASETSGPGALVRGGAWGHGASAGPFAVLGDFRPSSSSLFFGFRGAR